MTIAGGTHSGTHIGANSILLPSAPPVRKKFQHRRVRARTRRRSARQPRCRGGCRLPGLFKRRLLRKREAVQKPGSPQPAGALANRIEYDTPPPRRLSMFVPQADLPRSVVRRRRLLTDGSTFGLRSSLGPQPGANFDDSHVLFAFMLNGGKCLSAFRDRTTAVWQCFPLRPGIKLPQAEVPAGCSTKPLNIRSRARPSPATRRIGDPSPHGTKTPVRKKHHLPGNKAW